ncbi:MAG: ATP-binding protein [Anaerolineae bacterium]|nr:ATP-binding protein [Anaerolineae bacterium]
MATRQLVVFAGPPATGKTSLARTVARELRAVYLDKDTIKDVAVAVGREMKLAQALELAGPLSYELLVALARDNLTLGLSVVLDSPAGYRRFRERVEQMARAAQADLKLIECICTNESLLRDRIERRGQETPDYRPHDWESYQRERAQFERLTGPRLIVDTAEPLQLNVRKVLNYLGVQTQSETDKR